jgi:hypothetical protein
MLLDNLARFVDGVTPTTTGVVSQSLEISNYAGRDEPTYFLVEYLGTANQAVNTLTILFQESADNNTFTDVSSWTLAKPIGKPISEIYQIPSNATKRFARLKLTASATATNLTVSAGFIRERFLPYGPGQYIDKGKVIG